MTYLSYSFHPCWSCTDSSHHQLTSKCVSLFSIFSIEFLSFLFFNSSGLMLEFICNMRIFYVLLLFYLFFFLNKLITTCFRYYSSFLFYDTISNFLRTSCYYLALIRSSVYLFNAGGFRADWTLLKSSFFIYYFYFH